MSAFTRFAQEASRAAGQPAVFALALGVVVVWLLAGPLVGFSEKWMWLIHTVTSIVTFVLVFLLHNAENRNTEAMQIKLDEIVRSLDRSRKAVLDLEELDEHDLARIQKHYEDIAARAREEGKDLKP